MLRITLILLVVGAMTNAFCQSTPPVEYKDLVGNRYRIQYPSSWQIDISRKMGADLLLFSPLEGGSDTFRDNVNVIIQDLTGRNMDLAKYKVFTDDQLKRISRSIEIYESVLDDNGDNQFYYVSYAMTQGQYRLRIMTKCFIANNKAYLATFTCELNKFEQYSAVASDVLKSFKLSD
jgi:hypothetical protein